MKCAKCSYQNKADASACNLCGAVLRKERSSTRAEVPVVTLPKEKHLLVRVGAPPIVLEPGAPFTFGRQPGCSLTVPSNRVSRLHAEIRWENDRPILCDKGSSNGTFVKGKRVTEHALATGDEVEIGPFLCVYKFADPSAPEEPVDDAPEGTQTIAATGDIFTGLIGDAGLAEVLQGLEFNGKTGTLDIFGRDGDGWVSVKGGVPLQAEAPRAGLKDEEAVLYLCALKSGRFSFTSQIENPERRMKATLTAILLEWGRRADEKGKDAAQARDDRNTTQLD